MSYVALLPRISQAALLPGDHALVFTSTCDATAQPVRLFVPRVAPNARSLPLVVVLHGKWVDQNAWFDHTPIKEVAEMRGYLVAAPYGRGNWYYRGPGEQDVLDIIDLVEKEFPVNPDRVYLMGHSMGGWGTWWIGLRHPDLFATVSPMAAMNCLELLPNARHLAPFILHDSDDPIIPIRKSREAAARLIDLGISFQYREESGYGHSSKMIGDNFQRLFDWMDHHRRVASPRHITFVARTPKAGKAYWLRILQTEQFPKPASVDATVDSSGSLTVKTDNVAQLAIDLDASPAGIPETLPICINGSQQEIEGKTGILLLTRAPGGGGWTHEIRRPEAIPRYESPVIAEVPEAIRKADSTETLGRAIGERIRSDAGADAALIADDMFRLPNGPFTADVALDLYVPNDWRVARFRINGADLDKASVKDGKLDKLLFGPFFMVGSKPRPDSDSVVVAPAVVPEALGLPFELLPESMPELIFRLAKDAKTFP